MDDDMILCHDDGPCSNGKDNTPLDATGKCPVCNIHPDMQSTCFIKVKKKTLKELELENSTLRDYCKTLQHWARRYCDNRATYVTSWFNEITSGLIKMGIDLEKCDGIIWARDQHGRDYDKLTKAQATEDTPEALGKNV